MATSVLLGVVLACASSNGARDAEACGGFFSMRAKEARRPSLAYEQALIVYDAKSSKEHFVREVTFDGASESFGFVVPTPTRPEVAKVDKSPFEKLRSLFPFSSPQASSNGIGTLGRGGGAGSGFGSGVKVLETKRIGKLTAFVLRAEDPKELATWLQKHGLVSTPEADRWLEHYVKMRFYYVAMRYDGAKQGETTGITSETVRISFASPAPYYPYFEPAPDPRTPQRPNRLLDLWLVSDVPVVPVATLQERDTIGWVRPLRAGQAWNQEFPSELLEPALARLLPKGSVSIQTFSDQKVSRVGFGDIVFVPRAAPADAAARRGSLEPLLGVLDPKLVTP